MVSLTHFMFVLAISKKLAVYGIVFAQLIYNFLWGLGLAAHQQAASHSFIILILDGSLAI